MKRTGLITLILLVLWLGAANHCIFEAVFSNFSEINFSELDGNCPSHSSNDSQQHQEGARCSASVTTEVKNITIEQHVEVFSLLPVAVFVLNEASKAFHSSDVASLFLTFPNFSPSTELLAALVSPNAPPVSLSV